MRVGVSCGAPGYAVEENVKLKGVERWKKEKVNRARGVWRRIIVMFAWWPRNEWHACRCRSEFGEKRFRFLMEGESLGRFRI